MTIEYFIDTNFWIYLHTLKDEEDILPFKNFLLSGIPKGLATDILVFDEFIYISKKRYKIPYLKSIEFWNKTIALSCSILPINSELLPIISKNILEYSLKPSDAIHSAVTSLNKINFFVSEDSDFTQVKGIKLIWLSDFVNHK